MLNKKQKKYIAIMLVCAFLVSTTVFFVLSKLVTKPATAIGGAIVYTWSGEGDGNTWGSDANWNGPAGYPDDTDDKAIINSTNNDISAAALPFLLLGDLDIGAGYSGTLSITNLSIQTGGAGSGSFTLSGGTFRPNGSSDAYGAVTLNGGTLDLATNNALFGARYTVINGGTINKSAVGGLNILGEFGMLGCSTGTYTDNTGSANFGRVAIVADATLSSNMVSDSLYLQGCTLITAGYDADINGSVSGLDAYGINATAGGGGTSDIRVSGNFSPGAFTQGTSTVIADGTGVQTFALATGNVIYYNLSIENTSSKLNFSTGVEKVVISTLTALPGAEIEFSSAPVAPHEVTNLDIQGTAGNLVLIYSNNPGSAFKLNVSEASPSVEYVDVKDSNASSGNGIVAVNSINSGNNTNWTFVNDPDTPINLTQKDGSGNTIAAGGTTTSTSIQFGATLADDNADQVQLCVETQPVGTAFTNTETSCGSLVASGATGAVTLNNQASGSYHWQARAKDAGGRTSSWVSFGNPTDYIIAGNTTTTTTTTTKTATSTTTNTDSGTTTTTTTTSAGAPLCGNNALDPGEQCDAGVDLGACPKTCSSTCTINDCGIVVELPVPEDPGDTIVIIDPPSTIGSGDDLTVIIEIPDNVTVIDIIIDGEVVARTQVNNLELLVDKNGTNIYRYTDRQNFSAGKHTLRIRGYDIKGNPLYSSKPITFQVVKNAITIGGFVIPLWLIGLIGLFLPPLGMLLHYLPYAKDAFAQITEAYQLRSFRAAYPIFWSMIQTIFLILIIFLLWRRKKRKKRK